MTWVLRVLREPLVHFLVLASGLFALSHYLGETSERGEADTITVSEARISNLAQMWQRTWQRPPTKAELEGLIDDFIDEEVFYREALRMGLDRDDTVIRRRLRQKLEFVAEDLADTVEPTDEQLRQFLGEHPDVFRIEPRATFRHVYLNRQRRGDSLDRDVERLLGELNDKESTVDAVQLGDPFLLLDCYENLRESEIANLFGPEFCSQLLELDAGRWTGPIESGYGVHLVLVEERSESSVPELDDVRDAVQREWYAARRASSKEGFYRSLRQRYEIVVSMPEAENAATTTTDSP